MKEWILQGLKWKRCERGAAIIEFSIVLPLLVFLFVGIMDMTNYLLAYNKASRTAASIVNAISRLELTDAQLNDIMGSADVLMKRYDLDDSNSNVIVSSFGWREGGGGVELLWQRKTGSNAWSALISAGSLPANLSMAEGQGVLAVEVNYQFVPFVTGLILGQTVDVYGYAFGRSRSAEVLEEPA